ncbi:PHD finger domain protein [Cordyceps fumosorosea ARSEF 2679]|uniref:PHD finger domain protein n=1 Tax=Cordyceps fumosorosea (strain ARSEF 2679) TaxID=1081104 RepID=A0A162MSK5_CORFA|nr:PHD finger domain protein [Cordyceps fumosorosea ARSEF 2679]OAA66290.1 PHD finger domain protein [Cordyceps fumosorosea ARSEF 2679]
MTDARRDSTSFGDPNAQPPTPLHTPTSAEFASPVFETPRQPHGSFTDLGSSTPCFAEEYSVFNATPGNLKASPARFPDFVPHTPATSHKRLHSAEGFALEIATHANHFSPSPNLPPVDPSKRLASSPSLNTAKASLRETTPVPSPSLNKARSAKKPRRGTVTKDSDSHIISPPPTAHKGEQKLAPNSNMQYDQPFHQPDFAEGSQPHDVSALMANPGDIFSYPLSAPAGAPSNFWDPNTSMGMDLDFNATQGLFPPAGNGHRQTGSFDWNTNIQLFQDPNMVPPSSNQENAPPQPQAVDHLTVSEYPSELVSPFAMMNTGEIVDPTLMMGQDVAMPAFSAAEQAMPVPVGKTTTKPDIRTKAKNKSQHAGKAPDRTLASAPLKNSGKGLDQPAVDPRGRATLVRSNTLPTLAPAARPMAHIRSGPADARHPMARPNGRISPVKSQRRLSSLAMVRESSPARQLASVRFTIDARGRARAEATMESQHSINQSLSRCQSSRNLSSRSTWNLSSESESEDDEPIIIPSRNNSFSASSASYALPDPRKPIGSIFHRPSHSTSDRSSSSASAEGGPHGDESEAEPTLYEQRRPSGDAASELYKLVESRQMRSSQSNMPGRLLTNLGNFPSDTVSPASLAESGYGTEVPVIRCVCKRTGASKKAFMVQW